MKQRRSKTPVDSTRQQEAKLIERAKKRDPQALRALIDAHKDRLNGFVWRMVRNRDDAEEICQEAFLKAISSLDSFDPTYRFSTWLYTIAYRLTLNSVRRRRPHAADVDFGILPAAGETADQQSAASEDARRVHDAVWQAVEKLTPPQRAAVLLFYRHEQSCQEIAETLEVPVATVKSHLHRARNRLKDMLGPLVSDESGANRILGGFAG